MLAGFGGLDGSFFNALAAILVVEGVVMHGLTWLVHHFPRWRLRPPQDPPIPSTLVVVNTNLNNLLSLVVYALYFYVLGPSTLYHDPSPGLAVILRQATSALLVYDFSYYWFHRFMHFPKLMPWCHGVHHRVRSPEADQSTYLHPAETIGGVGLVVLGVWVVGPISTTAFLWMFAFHSTVNIIVHSGLDFPAPYMWLFNYWVRKHDVHHAKLINNYATIFPFWDMMFGTFE